MTHLRCSQIRRLAWAACVVLGSVGGAVAQPAPSDPLRGGRVTITTMSHGDDAIVAAEAGGVRLEHRASRGGGGRIVLTAGRSRVEVAVAIDALRLDVGGTARSLAARTVTAADVQGVRNLLHEVPAVAALVRLQAAFDDRTPAPLVSAAAFVRWLAGDAGAMRRVAAAARAAGPGGIQFARQEAAACWSSYQNSMWIFFIDLESCISTHSWNMPLQYACSFTYLVQSEIAWFNLIACAGGLPAS